MFYTGKRQDTTKQERVVTKVEDKEKIRDQQEQVATDHNSKKEVFLIMFIYPKQVSQLCKIVQGQGMEL